jgi:hypothetical protein
MRPGDDKLGLMFTERESYCYAIGICEGQIKQLGSTNCDQVVIEALERYRRVLAKQLVPSEKAESTV